MYKWLLLHYGSVKEPKLQIESIKIENEKKKNMNRFKIWNLKRQALHKFSV